MVQRYPSSRVDRKSRSAPNWAFFTKLLVVPGVFVTDPAGSLVGVLTERDIFGKLVATGIDLDQPVENLMITHPWTLNLDQPIRYAIDLMQTGRYRNVPLVDVCAVADTGWGILYGRNAQETRNVRAAGT